MDDGKEEDDRDSLSSSSPPSSSSPMCLTGENPISYLFPNLADVIADSDQAADSSLAASSKDANVTGIVNNDNHPFLCVLIRFY